MLNQAKTTSLGINPFTAETTEDAVATEKSKYQNGTPSTMKGVWEPDYTSIQFLIFFPVLSAVKKLQLNAI